MGKNRTEQAQLVAGTTLDPAQGVTQLALYDANGNPVTFEGLTAGTHIAAIATVDATDLASALVLANATKAKVNALIASLQTAGLLAAS